MLNINPKDIFRNYIAQQAIKKDQKGYYAETNLLLKVLQHPFDEQPELERFAEPSAEGAKRIVVS